MTTDPLRKSPVARGLTFCLLFLVAIGLATGSPAEAKPKARKVNQSAEIPQGMLDYFWHCQREFERSQEFFRFILETQLRHPGTYCNVVPPYVAVPGVAFGTLSCESERMGPIARVDVQAKCDDQGSNPRIVGQPLESDP